MEVLPQTSHTWQQHTCCSLSSSSITGSSQGLFWLKNSSQISQWTRQTGWKCQHLPLAFFSLFFSLFYFLIRWLQLRQKLMWNTNTFDKTKPSSWLQVAKQWHKSSASQPGTFSCCTLLKWNHAKHLCDASRAILCLLWLFYHSSTAFAWWTKFFFFFWEFLEVFQKTASVM